MVVWLQIHHVGNEEGNFIQFAYGDKHSVHRIRSVATDSSGHMAVLENGGRVKIFDISEMHAKPPSEKGEDEVMSAFKLIVIRITVSLLGFASLYYYEYD